MTGEWYIIFSVLAGSGLFAAGGTDIKGTGYKWLRREILPAIWAILAFTAGFEWWRCVCFAISQDVVFRLPYGERTPPWLKLIIFMAYPLPSLFLGFNIWQACAGIVCFIFWALSNWKPTAKAFEWVVSCLLIGAVLGITIGKLISQTY